MRSENNLALAYLSLCLTPKAGGFSVKFWQLFSRELFELFELWLPKGLISIGTFMISFTELSNTYNILYIVGMKKPNHQRKLESL